MFIIRPFSIAALVLCASSPVVAETVSYTREYTYVVNEDQSRASVRDALVLRESRKIAAERGVTIMRRDVAVNDVLIQKLDLHSLANVSFRLLDESLLDAPGGQVKVLARYQVTVRDDEGPAGIAQRDLFKAQADLLIERQRSADLQNAIAQTSATVAAAASAVAAAPSEEQKQFQLAALRSSQAALGRLPQGPQQAWLDDLETRLTGSVSPAFDFRPAKLFDFGVLNPLFSGNQDALTKYVESSFAHDEFLRFVFPEQARSDIFLFDDASYSFLLEKLNKDVPYFSFTSYTGAFQFGTHFYMFNAGRPGVLPSFVQASKGYGIIKSKSQQGALSSFYALCGPGVSRVRKVSFLVGRQAPTPAREGSGRKLNVTLDDFRSAFVGTFKANPEFARKVLLGEVAQSSIWFDSIIKPESYISGFSNSPAYQILVEPAGNDIGEWRLEGRAEPGTCLPFHEQTASRPPAAIDPTYFIPSHNYDTHHALQAVVYVAM